jgi:hypothetical protein
MSKVIHVFLGSDLRAGHNGLFNQAKASGVKVKELPEGSAIIFINRKKNKLKSYAWNGVVSYIRSDETNRPIDLSVIDELPRAFDSNGRMDYAKALKATLEKKLQAKKLDPLFLK